MKKNFAAILILTLCLLLFTACGESNEDTSTKDEASPATVDEATVAPEDFRADNEFAGDYSNDEYTAQIVKNANEELSVTITSTVQDGKSCEWTMSGYLSDVSYKMIYDNAVKTVITYNSEGKEKSRETEYESGSGKLVFDDNNGFTWYNGMENIENNVFART